jgi:hypothetical protein
MQQIELYLEKFKHIGSSDFLLKKNICEVVNNAAHINLVEDEISLGNGVLYLKISGPRRTEFALRKDAVIEALETKLDVV